MKKTLIALAVAASAAVSGSAMADVNWGNPGDFNGSVDIGGIITKPQLKNNWVWGVGGGFDKFAHTVSHLTESGTKLTITVDKEMPILLGKTVDVFPRNLQDAQGAAPQITYTGFDGQPAEMEGVDFGKMNMVIPVKEKDGQDKTGNLTIHGSISNVAFYMSADGSKAFYGSLRAEKPGEVFYGGVANKGIDSRPSTDSAFGLPSLDDMKDMMTTKYPGITMSVNSAGLTGTASKRLDGGVGYYGFGVKTGQSLDVKFDKAVTDEMEWVAPLNIQVSYY